MTIEILGDSDEATQFKEQENLALTQPEYESENDSQEAEVSLQ